MAGSGSVTHPIPKAKQNGSVESVSNKEITFRMSSDCFWNIENYEYRYMAQGILGKMSRPL